MPATFKITLAASADADGLHDVRLRITVNRISRFTNTGVTVAEKHWNVKATLEKENWVKSSHREYTQYNKELLEWYNRARKLAQQHPTWSADQLKATLRNGDLDPTAPDFFAFCRRRLQEEQKLIDEAYKKGVDSPGWSQGTIDSRTPIVDKLETWYQRECHSPVPVPLPIPLITEELLKKYERYLLTELGNAGTTTVKNLKTLHSFIREAIKKRLLTPDKDPMALYEYPEAKPKRVWMDKQEVDNFETVALAKERHLARAVYYLQYYLHGSRIGVILRLKWKDRAGGRVRFVMDKGGRLKEVEETPELAALLDSFRPADGSKPKPDSYILPYLPANFEQLHPRDQLELTKQMTSKINANLKRAAKQYGISKKLSSHVARRTLATLADRTLKGDLRGVGSLLGHTNTRTTQLYLQQMDTYAVDEHARQVYQALSTTSVQQVPDTGRQSLSKPVDKKPVDDAA
ncbi:tyrosine-type recombinase/integrase [Hymenobacter sp. YC55]|uniref:tyrosine-type recombinase/integrase n=1 Tax=Hymenobacter sp. YC55 TaxID=3034019 RepID=UPI0023F6272D|nr:tyrosine-type recombinase/integrase [Hymenobacter sp. YC55]MDF7813641.1 tyrosine-type recombinase/integrase [Hymenobacter sp. YC55]